MTRESVDGPVTGDALGTILARCWAAGARPGVAAEVIERDDGYIGVTDAVRYFSAPPDWSAISRWACDQARGRVLDVGCGAGRHAVVIHSSGREVVGLDTSPGAARVARDRGVTVVEGSIYDPPGTLGRFDTLLLLGNNLGLLGGHGTAELVLANLARLAAPGARIVAGGRDPYQTTDPDHLAYHERNRRLGRYPGQLRLRVRDGRIATDWFDYLFLSREELGDLVAGSGWRVADFRSDGDRYLVTLRLEAA